MERGKTMSEYIKKEDVLQAIAALLNVVEQIDSADVIEVGKAYPSAELEKYGLTEWKDKDGHKWVMVERRNNE